MKIDLPPSKLRCLRGEITNDELLVILKKVLNLQFSLAEMQKECCRTKEMRALQNFFVRGTECESWDDAKTKYVDVWFSWFKLFYLTFSLQTFQFFADILILPPKKFSRVTEGTYAEELLRIALKRLFKGL